ncbi:type III polyketide synthase [Maritimibacter sp. UBA3975]|uniref:type III polyketide synthase n=1 Tax=Maritimibacter sp. UBA3975 TaxID=1946833 RepID=UPI000C09EE25|nr:type III polyketide synthase [Maritimibacter sp. UBA3975]MAM60223.1 type III polyketide synthase [Maritimibacter sp.]|tara:strand:- start:4136 stop:5215 length:1080 start_codon:yes stop_codon:yes gene_type:complete
MPAYLNEIGTAVPVHDVHAPYLEIAPYFLPSETERRSFAKMAKRAGITHRYSTLEPADPSRWTDRYDAEGFYRPGAFPTTGERMKRYSREAPLLVDRALADLAKRAGGGWAEGLTHLVICTCTGFAAPGLDHHLVNAHGIPSTVERTLIGFMGCNAAINGYKTARHIVISDPSAKVLVLNVELCGLHFQENAPLQTALMFMLFADGAAAALVSAEPTGFELEAFRSDMLPDSRDHITWDIGDDGFDMWLSGRVPRTIFKNLPGHFETLAAAAGRDIDLWAIHPGGRTIIDAVEASLSLTPADVACSRGVLNDFGNMSSATLPFVLQRMLSQPRAGRTGVAIGFGPGVSVESMVFSEAAQ